MSCTMMFQVRAGEFFCGVLHVQPCANLAGDNPFYLHTFVANNGTRLYGSNCKKRLAKYMRLSLKRIDTGGYWH